MEEKLAELEHIFNKIMNIPKKQKTTKPSSNKYDDFPCISCNNVLFKDFDMQNNLKTQLYDTNQHF